jgi:tight adherence protein B
VDSLVVITGVVLAGAVFTAVLALTGSLASTRAAVVARTVGGQAALEARPTLNVPTLHSDRSFSGGLAFTLERAGLALTVTEYVSIRTAIGLVAGLAAALLANRMDLGTPYAVGIAAIGFVLGYWLPARYVAGRTAKRLRRVEDQLVEALVSMAKSLKAGVGLTQAMEYAGRDIGEPLGPEILRVVRDLQLGADPEVAFEELTRRIGSRDLEIASTAIIIQRRVGGNLSEILTNVANTIRERSSIRNELHSLTAKQRLQGNLSAALPPIVALIFFALNPDVADVLVTTTAGRISLGVGIFFELLGLWLVRRFGQIDV